MQGNETSAVRHLSFANIFSSNNQILSIILLTSNSFVSSDVIKKITTFDITTSGAIEVQVGILEGMSRFSVLEKEKLLELKLQLEELGDFWVDIDRVRISFIAKNIQYFENRIDDIMRALNEFENVKPLVYTKFL